MDRITAVLKLQWRAYWRRFRGSTNLRANNAGAVVLIGGLLAVRFFQQLPLAASQLSHGETTRYEALLIAVFVAWMVPVMGESRRSIASRSLLHFPLTSLQLFAIRVGSVFCSPVSWIVFALSLALVYPIAVTAHPFAGFIGLLVFLLLGLFVSLTITHLLQGVLARRFALVVLLTGSVAAGFIWVGKQTQLVGSLRSLLPDRLAVAAAASSTPFRAVGILIVITAFFAAMAFWSFTLTLYAQQSPRAPRSVFFTQLPGKFGGLLRKDLRYSSRLLDLYLVLPIVIVFDIYLASDAAPSAIAFNCFGLDSALGFDRYMLFPLSGKQKLISKNLAFTTMMLALFATNLPLVWWRLGLRVSLPGLLEFAAVALAYLSCGNWFSVKQPYKMQFYRFASGGSLVDLVIGILFASLPAAVTVYLFATEDAGASWKIAGVTLVSLALYLFSLSRAGRTLENDREAIRRALS